MFLSMWQVLLNVTPQTAYEAELRMTLNNIFLSTDPGEYEPPAIDGMTYLYDVGEFRSFVNQTIVSYQNLTNTENGLLDIIEPLKNSTGEYEPIYMYYVSYYKNQT